ncbi:MAG: S46 family peptidase [Flavobacteriaceae bacterium]|nr:S46 family peptidase [Flavobacteriaceae bacterium]
MKRFTIYLVAFLALASCATVKNTSKKVTTDTKSIQGGMWIPSLLEGMNEQEMQLLGSKMSAEDIYSVNHSSLKDAIVHFDGGCTAEVISPKGLLLTNHHCGYGAIQSHSSVKHNYLKDGFWAKNFNEELPNPDMTVTFIVRIEDVTAEVLAGITESMNEVAKEKLVQKNIKKVVKNTQKESWQGVKVKSFYKGNQYFRFITETFKDIRLVGAPPSSIGKFGSDTDNWMWPRHTADFSMFRIYANKDNKPAEYSKDNVPYTPKHFLPISLDGVEEGDFTLVFGFPGRTNEYLPSVAVKQTVKVINPARIEVRDEALKIMDSYMRKDPATKIKYASKYAGIANYWKKWIGENQGIEKSNAIGQKQALEKEFSKRIQEKELIGYQSILSDFEKYYRQIQDVELAYNYWAEVAYRSVELLKATFKAYQLEQAYARDGKNAFENAKNSILNNYKGLYKNYEAKVDKPVFKKLMSLYQQKMPQKYLPNAVKTANINQVANDIYSQSAFTNLISVEQLLNGTPDEVIRKLNQDKGYQFGKELHNSFYQKIIPDNQAIELKIADVQKKYMKALREVFPNKRFFPDANSTLRVTYGQVKGYYPTDGVYYRPQTYLKGVIEKYVPNDYEFDVPQKLRTLYTNKNFGQYADKNGKMPVCFIGTNHTTGGNSGSPVLDAHGNLIGLNFDRVWEGTMSDMNYDADICRNIMVDARYILFIIDKYADAQNIIKELKLVHPK